MEFDFVLSISALLRCMTSLLMCTSVLVCDIKLTSPGVVFCPDWGCLLNASVILLMFNLLTEDVFFFFLGNCLGLSFEVGGLSFTIFLVTCLPDVVSSTTGCPDVVSDSTLVGGVWKTSLVLILTSCSDIALATIGWLDILSSSAMVGIVWKTSLFF